MISAPLKQRRSIFDGRHVFDVIEGVQEREIATRRRSQAVMWKGEGNEKSR